MHAGLQILIERMKTHPDEFWGSNSWWNLVDNFKQYLTEDERKVYEEARVELMRGKLTEMIMDRLIGDKQEGMTLTYNADLYPNQAITIRSIQEEALAKYKDELREALILHSKGRNK